MNEAIEFEWNREAAGNARVQKVDVVILGAGAAGLMCAIEAGRRGRRVVLLDHAERIGKKILISGGGRCNFTNIHCRPENFLSENPHFAKSALARFTPADIIAMVEKHGIRYHEKTLGQLFCDRSAHDIVTMLERECADAGVRIIVGARIISVTRNGSLRGRDKHNHFRSRDRSRRNRRPLHPEDGRNRIRLHHSRTVRPSHRSVPTRSRPARLQCRRPRTLVRSLWRLGRSHRNCGSTQDDAATFREKMLITHRGLSGPAILQASSYWQPGEAITLDLAPEVEALAPLLSRNARRDADAAALALRATSACPHGRTMDALHHPNDWTNASLAATEQQLHAWKIMPAGTEGYAKAEVTAGGVDTAELDAKTMQCRKVPGLYFIGEVVDVTGWLGGYNFQWAWASGFSAGQAV